MANLQYIGARYVPKFFLNPDDQSNDWKSGVGYEALTVVTYLDDSYTSKVTVPGTIGNPADNPSYWVKTGNYNAALSNLQNEVSDINNFIGSEELTTDSDTISGGVNELNRTKNKPISVLNPVKYGGIIDTASYGVAQGACMTGNNTCAQWFDAITSGYMRLLNLATGTYTDYPIDIITHGNSMAFNGEKIALTGYSQNTHTGHKTIYTFNPSLPTVYEEIDLSSVLPFEFNFAISAITWDNNEEAWILLDAENFTNGITFAWVNSDFSETIKTITVQDSSIKLSSFQDMCFDGKLLYRMSIDPNMLVAIDPVTCKIIEVSEINRKFDTALWITEMESIDFYNNKFFVTSDSGDRHYSNIIHSYGYFNKEGNIINYQKPHDAPIYVNGTGGFSNDGSNDRPYKSILEALLTHSNEQRNIVLLADLNEPLYIEAEHLSVTGNNHSVKGVLVQNSNVELIGVYASDFLTDDYTACFNFWRSSGRLVACGLRGISLTSDKYRLAAVSGSIVSTTFAIYDGEIISDNSSIIETYRYNLYVYIAANTTTLTVKMKGTAGDALRQQGLLVVNGLMVPFYFVINTTECGCGSGFTVTKVANSSELTFTIDEGTILANTIAAIIPLY